MQNYFFSESNALTIINFISLLQNIALLCTLPRNITLIAQNILNALITHLFLQFMYIYNTATNCLHQKYVVIFQ